MRVNTGIFLPLLLRDKTNCSDNMFQIVVSFCVFHFFNEGKVKLTILMIHPIFLDFWNNQDFLGWFFKKSFTLYIASI